MAVVRKKKKHKRKKNHRESPVCRETLLAHSSLSRSGIFKRPTGIQPGHALSLLLPTATLRDFFLASLLKLCTPPTVRGFSFTNPFFLPALSLCSLLARSPFFFRHDTCGIVSCCAYLDARSPTLARTIFIQALLRYAARLIQKPGRLRKHV